MKTKPSMFGDLQVAQEPVEVSTSGVVSELAQDAPKKSTLKYLIVARHGHYQRNVPDEPLSEKGVQEAQRLALHIEPIVYGYRTVVLSSLAMRAAQTAQTIGNIAHLEVFYHNELLPHKRRGVNNAALYDLVEKQSAEIVILVTHFEYCEQFTRYWAHKKLNVWFPPSDLETGQACVLDVKTQQLRVLPP